jgi:hypothetical protein
VPLAKEKSLSVMPILFLSRRFAGYIDNIGNADIMA